MKELLVKNTVKANNEKADKIFRNVKMSVSGYITSQAVRESKKGLHRVEIKLKKLERKNVRLVVDLLKQKGFEEKDIQITKNNKWLILKW